MIDRYLKYYYNFIISIASAYATVIFSESPLAGLLLICATLLDPITGITGLLGTITALIFARSFGYDSWESKSGLFAFNSLLTTLGVGYFYPLSEYDFFIWLIVVAVASILTLMFYLTLNSLTWKFFKLPSFSLAFSLVSILLCFFYYKICHFNFLTDHRTLLINWEPLIPTYFKLYFHSLGSIFYQPHSLIGMLIALAIFLQSRIGFLLSVAGYSIAYSFIMYWNSSEINGMVYPGFNLILTAMAIGGYFIVPGRASYMLMLIASCLGIVISFGLQAWFNEFTIPPFAFPFNITIIIFLYSLKLRLKNRNPYVIDFGILHPERSLEYLQSRVNRFQKSGVPQFWLPFAGEWKITQGHNGEFTHKLDWAYAWDFEIFDNNGKNFKNDAEALNDYYCYGKPVLASANGYVAVVVDYVPDNKIGQINTIAKWGNYVSIHHGEGVYSIYCHLKPGSIKVKPGDYIYGGEKLAMAGNSGRSAVPHLHFNIQNSPEAGARAQFSYLMNYKQKYQVSNYRFMGFGIPRKDDFISPLIPDYTLQEKLYLLYDQTQEFEVTCGKKKRQESWKVSVDLYGTFRIISSNNAILEFSVYSGIFNVLKFKGNKKTALWAFALLTTRLPYLEDQRLEWSDQPPYSVVLNKFEENLAYLITPLLKIFTITNNSVSKVSEEKIEVESTLKIGLLGITLSKYKGKVEIISKEGLKSLELYKNGKLYLTAEVKNQQIV